MRDRGATIFATCFNEGYNRFPFKNGSSSNVKEMFAFTQDSFRYQVRIACSVQGVSADSSRTDR